MGRSPEDVGAALASALSGQEVEGAELASALRGAGKLLPYTLRRASWADVPAIVRVINLAYRVEAFFVAGDRIDATQIEALLARGAFLLAESKGALVGSVYVEDRGDHGYIGLVSVDPEAQRAGVGRALMEAAEAAIAEAGRPRAEIQVVDLRLELPPWYRRLGYREVGARPFTPGIAVLRPCGFIVMSKRLRPRA